MAIVVKLILGAFLCVICDMVNYDYFFAMVFDFCWLEFNLTGWNDMDLDDMDFINAIFVF